jgi:argininosuccinate lyase
LKLWGGRFEKATDKKVDDFNSSIRFDQRLYRQDITGSIAHARMLGNQGIIPKDDSLLIIQTLKEILDDIEHGKVEFEIDAEDIHMNVEKILIERIGDKGKRLHTGRSRNDQVALDLRMYVKDEISEITKMLVELEDTLLSLAKEHTKTIMPGYTHLQKAQPITFAHHEQRILSTVKPLQKSLTLTPLQQILLTAYRIVILQLSLRSICLS